jgi:hypothetical protein
MTRYFREYSSMAKSFLISGGSHEGFKEFAGFCAQWMLLQSNPTAVSKVRGSLIIASWENRHLDWAKITSKAQVREVTANRKNRAMASAYWLGMICPPPPGLERPSSRQKDTAPQVAPEEDNAGRPARRQAAPEEAEAGRTQAPVRRPAPAAATTVRVHDPAKGKWLEEVPSTEKEKEKEKEKRKRKRAPGEEYEFWEIGTSRDAPPSPTEEEPERPKRRRLRRSASREDGTTTISVDRNPARGPPTRTTVRIVPREGRTQPGVAPAPPPPPPVAEVVTMEEEQPAAAAADVDIPAKEEILPEAEEHPVTAEEGTLLDAEERPIMAEEEARPDAEERPAHEREVDPAVAPQNIQVPTWNLEERIPIAPQEWDADTPQIGIGAADDGVEIIDLEESEQTPVALKPPLYEPGSGVGILLSVLPEDLYKSERGSHLVSLARIVNPCTFCRPSFCVPCPPAVSLSASAYFGYALPDCFRITRFYMVSEREG